MCLKVFVMFICEILIVRAVTISMCVDVYIGVCFCEYKVKYKIYVGEWRNASFFSYLIKAINV